MRSYLLIVYLSSCANGVLFRKSFPVLSFLEFEAIPQFSSIRFRFMLRSLIDLELSFVQGDEYGSI